MNDNNVRPYSVFATLVVGSIGVGIFSLPRSLAKNVGTDGWIVVLIAGIIVLMLTMAMCKVIELNNYKSFSNILIDNFGGVIGRIVAILFIVYCIVTIALQMRVFIEVVKMYLLEKTPTEFLLIVTILVGAYAINGGEKGIIKFNEIAFWFMFLPALLVFPALMKGADFTNILPIGRSPITGYGKEIMESLVSFAGIEILFFVAPFLQDKKQLKKATKKAMVFITLFYALIAIFTIAVFTKHEASKMLWPTITMVTSVDIPGAFIERWEGIIMSIWIIFYFTTFVNLYYFSSVIMKESFGVRQEKISAVILMPFIYAIALYGSNLSEIIKMIESILDNLAIGVDVALPLILLIISKIRSRKGGEKLEKKKAQPYS